MTTVNAANTVKTMSAGDAANAATAMGNPGFMPEGFARPYAAEAGARPPETQNISGHPETFRGILQSYAEDDEGVATVEIVLVLLVLIALVLIFKEQILKVLKNLMTKVTSQSNGV